MNKFNIGDRVRLTKYAFNMLNKDKNLLRETYIVENNKYIIGEECVVINKLLLDTGTYIISYKHFEYDEKYYRKIKIEKIKNRLIK